MAITRIQNNQITDSSSGNIYLGVNAASKVQDYSITAGKIQNNLTYGSDLTITGNLTVQGNTTTIDTVHLVVEDPLILLAKDQTGSPTLDIGFIGKRGTEDNIAFVWDESQDEFITAFTTSETTNTTISVNAYASLRTLDMNVTGNLSVTGNTSFTGNITSLVVTGNIDAGNYRTTGVVTATGNVTGGNVVTGGQVTATGNVTGANLTTGGVVDATGTITGGNLATGGTASAAGTITGGNLATGGTASAAGTITGGNLATGGTVSATGTATVGNLSTAGTVSATGNVTGGNLLTGGFVSATGNVDSGNVNTGNASVTGNVAAAGFTGTAVSVTGNVTAANFIGNISGNIDAGGANTNVQFNDGDILAGSANFTFDKSTNVMSVTGTIQGTTVSATGNATVGNLYTGGEVSAVGTVTGGYVYSSGEMSAAGNVVGGNVTTAGFMSATGNVTGANLLTGGQVSSTGNVTGGNLVTGGIATVAGTVTAGNVATAGTVSATGTITGGNLETGGTVSATGTATLGNVATGGTVSATGNVTGGNILTAGLISATGNITGGNLISGNAVIGNINVSGDIQVNSLTSNTYVSAIGNVVGGNLFTAGAVSAAGTITANLDISSGAAISATGNVTGGNIVTSGRVTATGNVTGGNLVTGGLITATGNVTGANVNAGADVSATGNIFGNNITSYGFVSAAGNVEAPTVVTGTVTTSSGDLVLNSAGGALQWDGSGNIVMNSQWINNLADPIQSYDAATKQYVDDSVSSGIHIHTPVDVETPVALPSATYNQGGTTATVTDTIAGNTVVFSTAVNPQPNDMLWFTNSFNGVVANIAYFVVSAPNTSAAVLSTTYNGTPVSNISNATGLTQAVRINSGFGANLVATANGALTVDSFSVSVGNRVLVYNQSNAYENGIYDVTDAGNVTAPWILTRSNDANTYIPDSTVGLDEGSYVYVKYGSTGAGESYVMTAPIGPFNIGQAAITFTQFSASQVYSANTAAGIDLTGTVFSAKVDNNTTAFDGGGNIIVKAGANLTSPNIDAATGTSLSLTGNLVSGNVNTGIMSASGNVTGANILTAGIVSAAGNITANYYFGNGSQLTGVAAASVDAGNLTGNTLSSNVIFSSLTTVGTLTSLSVSGNTTSGNLLTGGLVSATGNVTGANVLTGGYVSATGNVTGGNLMTGGVASVTGTVFGGNVSTNGFVTAGGNVTGGNFDTAGNVSATGNVIGGNLLTSGILSATGTATVGNLDTGGNVSATGNVTGSNILTGGFVSATGNVAGGNLVTSGVASVTGTATVGNLATAGTVSATGNVTGGNVLTGGYVSATGNLDGANVNTGNVVATGTISATGNVAAAGFTGGNASVTGNVAAVGFTGGNVSVTGNVTAQNFIGNISGNIDAGGANTNVQFNDGDLLAGSNNFTFDKSTNVMSVTGTIEGTTVSSTGNVIAGNVTTAGLVTATGNVTGGNLVTGGLATVTGNVIGGNITTAGLVTATGNITGGNVLTGGLISATGNISSSANIVATANVIGGNLSTAGLITASGNITGANLILTSGTVDGPASGRIDVNGSGIDTDFAVSGDTVANIMYIDAGTGTASFGSSAQTTNAIVAFNATNSVLMPVGNTLQRPGTGVVGMLRFNSTGDSLEVYTSSGWEDVGVPAFTVITADSFTGNGVQTLFTLSANSTTAATIVSINGIVQEPTTAYSVSGANLQFTEAPGPSDTIDARLLTTTTTVTAIDNTSGNAIVEVLDSADTVQITGNLLPAANITFNLGSPTKSWNNAYFSGSTIFLGNLQLKQVNATTFGVFQADGTTAANVDVGSIDVSSIIQGTSEIGISGINGNGYFTIGGTSNVLVVANTGTVTTGFVSATGNITGNYIFGNGSQLTGIDATSIQNGTANVRTFLNGNVTTSAAGTANVLVVSATGSFVTGLSSVTGNVDAGNLRTGGSISATGAITTGGDISLTGNIVDAAALTVSTGSNGNITLSPNGTGVIIAMKDLLNGQANGVGNIGNATGYFNTIHAKATSAQYADLAEMYEADRMIDPGTVVCFGGSKEVEICDQDSCRRIAGVVSTNPSYIMNAGLAGDHVVAVALTGRVPCKVTGTIRKGDMLVSTADGRARAETNPAVGAVIGKALADFDGADGTIEVVVGRL